jgi:hypothetical protein
MARPSKLDDITAQRVINAVKRGLPRTHAARLARINPDTLFEWLRRGREGEPGYSEFSERVREAEAYDVDELLGYMREHAKVSHQACAWLLERRAPKYFAARKPEPVADAVTPEEAERLIAAAKALP